MKNSLPQVVFKYAYPLDVERRDLFTQKGKEYPEMKEIRIAIMEWQKDGPCIPVEFTRQSNDGRMTLIIDEKADDVQVLWAIMSTENLSDARESLRDRDNDLVSHGLSGSPKDCRQVLKAPDFSPGMIYNLCATKLIAF